MLDRDLAELYGVQTKVLKQAVKRNIQRFPPDFMFEPNSSELAELRSQFVTSDYLSYRNHNYANRYLFTENGIAMLSSILGSDQAIMVNIVFTNSENKLFEIVFERIDTLKNQ